VTRFQQTSPPVTAKGVEDTAFYRYHRLLALNEVGGDPARFGLSVEGFHAANLERAARFPRGLLVTQTHDTKRSGDVRARIGALSTMPAEWRERVMRWHEIAEPLRSGGAPDASEEYFVYQTLVGAHPIEPERLAAYLEKALREAKRTTNWIEPDEAWEQRVKDFTLALLEHEPFRADFDPFAERVAREGRRSALAQTLLKLTSPGLPDVYQGDELEALSLVDPDNRRPVDWASRRSALAALRKRRSAHPGDHEARDHLPGARAAHPPPRGVRRARKLRATRRGAGRVRVQARQRRRGRGRGARLERRRGRGASRARGATSSQVGKSSSALAPAPAISWTSTAWRCSSEPLTPHVNPAGRCTSGA
jgi:(1->4)-alpha-D-glucan 1-alpha-D-glucosylmutase